MKTNFVHNMPITLPVLEKVICILLNWFDFVVYGLMIVLFIQAGCDLKIAKEEHVKILAFERWRVEVKARGGSSNGEISPSRFDRVRDVLTEVIHFLKLI